VDARLGKNCPGRNARFAGKERLNAAKNHVIRQRSSVLRKRRRRTRAEVMPGRTSGEVMLALTRQEAKTKGREVWERNKKP